MAFDFAALSKPLAGDLPCGPDLDLEGDPEFSNFVARADGLFPASFFTRDDEGRPQPFDRGTIDFPAEFKALDRLLESTYDLRLLTIYARLLILNRDVTGFARSVAGIATVLETFWDEVPPKGEDGDYAFRTIVLQGLDDSPSVVLPLQHAPILTSRRNGPISYRTIVVAAEEAPARDGEAVLDAGTLTRAMSEAELDDVKAARERIRMLADALDRIQALTFEKGGYEGAANLERLPPVVSRIATFLDGVLAERDPSLAPPPVADDVGDGGSGPSGAGAIARPAAPAGAIPDAKAAARALTAVLAYLRRHEPSNPAAHLVAQALAVQGKSFREVVALLLPDDAGSAKILLGPDRLFGLTFDQFAASEEAVAVEPEDGSQDDGESPSEDVDVADADDGGGDGEDTGAPSSPPRAAPTPPPQVGTRAEASALIDQVGQFYRRAEPSSPVPLFTDRARTLMDRDFMTILKDVLPSIVPQE